MNLDKVWNLVSARPYRTMAVFAALLVLLVVPFLLMRPSKNDVALGDVKERAEMLLKEAGGTRTLLTALYGQDPLAEKAMKQLDFDIMNLEGVVTHSKPLSDEQLNDIEKRLARASKVVDALKELKAFSGEDIEYFIYFEDADYLRERAKELLAEMEKMPVLKRMDSPLYRLTRARLVEIEQSLGSGSRSDLKATAADIYNIRRTVKRFGTLSEAEAIVSRFKYLDQLPGTPPKEKPPADKPPAEAE